MLQDRKNYEKIPVKRIIWGILLTSLIYNFREFLAEMIYVDGKLLSLNPTYRLAII